ncbi:MAG TPA: MBG domain-containing protein, partial [Chryseolinea sp.]|nr:MBG domain-containing protein [Chryseolinea sp.]
PIERDQIGSIEVRDFTFDGIPDVAVTCEYKFIIYPNDGVAGFATRDHYQIGSAANSISVGDFNGDGKQDVAVASISSQAVNVLIADTATEKRYYEARYFPTSRLPLSMAAGNFNNDEKDDLVVVGWPLHYLSVFISLPTLTITARDTLRTYGASNPFFKSKVVGLKNNDPIEITYTTPANTNSNIGEYEIVPVPDQVTMDNYAVVIKNGFLTVTPAPLKIRANDAARMFGEPNPDFTGIVEGLLNDDYVLVSYSTPAEENSSIGEYPIIPNLDWNGENYEPSYINGTLTITPVVGIESEQGLGSLNTYPNPSKGTFTINHAGSSTVSFEILEGNGRTVSKGKLIPGPNTIEIELNEGLYLIKFSNGTVKKIIIH